MSIKVYVFNGNYESAIKHFIKRGQIEGLPKYYKRSLTFMPALKKIEMKLKDSKKRKSKMNKKYYISNN